MPAVKVFEKLCFSLHYCFLTRDWKSKIRLFRKVGARTRFSFLDSSVAKTFDD